MPGTIKFETGSLGTLIDNTSGSPNTLASLGASTAAISPNSWDNTPATGRGDFFGDFELSVGMSGVPTAGLTFDLYLLESADGTNFGDGAGGNAPTTANNHFVGSFVTRAVQTPQRLYVRNIPLPPTAFKVLLVNSTDKMTAPAASGMTLKLLPYREQYT